MTDQLNNLSSTTSTASTGLAGLSGTLQGTLTNLSSNAQSLLDRIIPPSTRQSLKSKLTNFASERPLLASFILSHLAISGLPLALFLIMSLTVVIFALLTGLLVGLLGALVFIVLALGFALFILLPTLFATTFFAVAVWLWGVGAYYLVKWFNEKKVPGVHRPLGEGLSELTGLGDIPGLKKSREVNQVNGDGHHTGEMNGRDKRDGETETRKKDGNSRSTGREGQQVEEKDGKDQVVTKTPVKLKKVKDVERLSSKTPTKGLADASEGVTDVGKGVTGLVS